MRLMTITVLALVLGSNQLHAESKMAVPKDAKVQISGNTARINAGGGTHMTGTFTCTCSEDKGTCQLETMGTGLICKKGNGTCKSSCDFESATTGLTSRRPQ